MCLLISVVLLSTRTRRLTDRGGGYSYRIKRYNWKYSMIYNWVITVRNIWKKK